MRPTDCFRVENIDKVYRDLKAKGVEFLSEPQLFDFRKDGFSKSKAVYFRDPDGVILGFFVTFGAHFYQ